MSKMPAKKKSCFQITSVTQAQVAASSITEDTESLDDPDESRTEDVSSEIFDVSRAELLGVCDRSSSEETLNNVGESQEVPGHLTGPVNGGPAYKSVGSGRNMGGNVPVPAASQPFVTSPVGHPLTSIVTTPSTSVTHTVVPASTSCTSRFRVIKLDHSSGEPFRRGRWTCTDFYEKDSDSNRTIDSVRPPLIPNHSLDRDIGLGTTSNSVITTSAFSSHSLEGTADSGYSVAHLSHPHPSESLHKGYSFHIGNGASAFQTTGFADASQQQVSMQPVSSQNFLSNSVNGVHQGAMQQKSPMMPPVTQTQHPFAYSGQPDYRQQHFVSSTQNLVVTSHSVGLSSCQGGPASIFMPSGLVAKGSMHHMGNMSSMVPIHPGTSHQQPVNPHQPFSGGLNVASTHSVVTTSAHSGMLNVPATVPSTTNNNTALGVPSQAPGNVHPQGAHGGSNVSLYAGFSIHAEDGRQKSDALPHSSIVPGRDAVKPFITEGLNLPSPAVNSLFNIHIAMDADEDGASGASVVAIDNKIEQAMDLVKSHLMYAVREEVEVLKEQIKELYERNSVLERENAVLKSLSNSEQLNQLSSQLTTVSGTSSPQQQQQQQTTTNSGAPVAQHDGSQGVQHHPNVTSA